MKRYIPELQSLAARVLADECRKMNSKERYYFLKEIPDIYKIYILAFPTNFICWLEKQKLLDVKLLKEFKSEILPEYEKNCKRGYLIEKIILRKCKNYYCDNLVAGQIINTPYYIIFNLCSDCSGSFGRYVRLREEINKFLKF